MTRLIIICLFAYVFLVCYSCSSDDTGSTGGDPMNECNNVMATYTDDVAFIINTGCATSGCHSASARANGIDLSTYEKVKEESARRRFLGAINREPGFSPMPSGGAKLSETSIATITCWIENGQPL